MLQFAKRAKCPFPGCGESSHAASPEIIELAECCESSRDQPRSRLERGRRGGSRLALPGGAGLPILEDESARSDSGDLAKRTRPRAARKPAKEREVEQTFIVAYCSHVRVWLGPHSMSKPKPGVALQPRCMHSTSFLAVSAPDTKRFPVCATRAPRCDDLCPNRYAGVKAWMRRQDLREVVPWRLRFPSPPALFLRF